MRFRWWPLIVGALAALPSLAWAECATFSVHAVPAPDQALPTNGRIVVVGFGDATHLVSGLAERKPVLTDGKERIVLQVVESHSGEMGLQQVVLKPVKELRPRTRYRLDLHEEVAAKAGANEDPRRAWLREQDKSMLSELLALAWTTAEGKDTTSPAWTKAPEVTGTDWIEYGCGPAVQAHVAAPATDEGAGLLVAVDLELEGAGKPSRYLLELRNGATAIGHGMCSGAFQLAPGRPYKATLTAVDFAGNATPAPGAPLRFVGPKPKAEK